MTLERDEVDTTALRIGFSFENERKLQSRSERLMEKELRDSSHATISLAGG